MKLIMTYDDCVDTLGRNGFNIEQDAQGYYVFRNAEGEECKIRFIGCKNGVLRFAIDGDYC